MTDFSDPDTSEPSVQRRRAATIAYIVVAVLLGWAIAREFIRVKERRPAAAVTSATRSEGLV